MEALRNSNIDVIVAANDNPKDRQEKYHIEIWQMGKRGSSKALKYKKDISITHAHYVFPSGVFSFMMKKMFNIPYVVTAHGGDIERMAKKSASIRNWTEKILQESSHVIAVGPVLAEQIEKEYGIPREQILVCSMGVKRQTIQARKQGNRQEKNCSWMKMPLSTCLLEMSSDKKVWKSC